MLMYYLVYLPCRLYLGSVLLGPHWVVVVVIPVSVPPQFSDLLLLSGSWMYYMLCVYDASGDIWCVVIRFNGNSSSGFLAWFRIKGNPSCNTLQCSETVCVCQCLCEREGMCVCISETFIPMEEKNKIHNVVTSIFCKGPNSPKPTCLCVPHPFLFMCFVLLSEPIFLH